MRLLFSVFLFFIYFCSIATIDNLKVNGYYFGENLIVMNPMIGNRYVVEHVKVNGTSTNDEIESSVFEIDFLALGLKIGDKVEILISYVVSTEKPQIYNPQVLEPESNFSFEFCQLDKKNQKINWTIKGSPGEEPFEIEQYRWDKWVRIGTMFSKDSISLNKYEKSFDAHKGKNLYRIKIVDSKGMIIYSPSLKFLSRQDEIFIENKKFNEEILFSGKTMYQIYDEKGTLCLSGNKIVVDITSMESGKYWINFDNKTEMIKIK